jgi:phage terminase large subunit-like protein
MPSRMAGCNTEPNSPATRCVVVKCGDNVTAYYAATASSWKRTTAATWLKPHAGARIHTSSRGKVIRAEPVSALYEQGRVHHAGAFQQLEDQMCAFMVDFVRKTMGYSPDRLDALVWALTELMVEVNRLDRC